MPLPRIVFVTFLLMSHLCSSSWAQKSGDELSIEAIRHPDNLELNLWAESSQLANPVAFGFDQNGAMYLCETFRQSQGVEDNRGHMSWLDDDLAAQTVEDRLAYFKKHLGDEISRYSEKEDRITRLIDSDKDGKADQYGVFADGFNDILAGTGASVLAHDGDVFYTCIPDVWKLNDTNNDGTAEKRESLSYGYGVRVAFRGHDSHGLIIGPDGRLYYSIGDRGYHVETDDGRVLHDPASGAVFRCELDGSNLEVFATGLRNPQELAFDDMGNLFTGDNNSDGGDEARMVHVVEGSDTGWRMYYQYLADRGPWNREKLWHPQHEGQAAYVVPPIRNFADGPSGFAYYPGTGLGDEYADTFFLCDFRGDAAISGIRSFRLEPKGASFEMTEPKQFLWNVLATDVDFGPDGSLYLTDWITGWEGIGRGRIVRVTNPAATKSKLVKQVTAMLAADSSKVNGGALLKQLGHPDRRVRMKAQMEIVKRGKMWKVVDLAGDKKADLLARLHSAWAMAQFVRTSKTDTSRQIDLAIQALISLAKDESPELRAAAIQGLGDLATRDATDVIREAIGDGEPRVASLAAIAIGKIKEAKATDELVQLIAKNRDIDPVIRHAGVVGLARTLTVDELLALKVDDRPAIRRAVVLALRRHKSPQLADFLGDSDSSIQAEAVLAIHDLQIEDAMSSVAKLAASLGKIEHPAMVRRILNANFREGSAENARWIASAAANDAVAEDMRLEALSMLEDWATPSSRDRVLGQWRPLDERSGDPANAALAAELPNIAKGPASVAIQSVRVASEMGIKDAGKFASDMVASDKFDAGKRAALLKALVRIMPDEVANLAATALKGNSPDLRAAARDVLIQVRPDSGIEELARVVGIGTTMEQQSALATLAELDHSRADGIVRGIVENQLLKNKLSPEVHLDIVEAAKHRGMEKEIESFLGQFNSKPYGTRHLATVGGDPARGQAIFEGNVTLSCTRCHRAAAGSQKVGPNLAGIGKAKKPEYLLEAILDPNKTIAEGFGTVVLVTEDGLQKQGVLQQETDEFIKLMDADGKLVIVPKGEILARETGKSAMPEDLTKDLSLFDLRDLMAYLQSLTEPVAESAGHE